MNKLTKIALAILTSLSISTASFAGELTVTGAAKATYSILSSDSTLGTANAPKGIGIANEFTLSASGELDNGYTWSYAQDIDGATVHDDAKLTMTTPYGTVGAFVSEGSLSAKYGFDASAYAPGSDYGFTSGSTGGTVTGLNAGFTYGTNISSYNNLQYHTPADALPYSTSIKIGFAPEASGALNSSNATQAQNEGAGSVTEGKITTSPVDGLTLAASYIEKDDEVGSPAVIQEYKGGSVAGKYALNSVTVGLGYTLHAPTHQHKTAGTRYVQHYENTSFSIGYAVNEALTVSYTNEESEAHTVTKDVDDTTTDDSVEFEIEAIQAAYTMGGMTLSLAHKSLENSDYTLNKDHKHTIFAVQMAF